PEAWTQFLGGQSPFAQNFMSSYLDQSNSLVTQMQEQMAKNANALFPGMPGFSTKASKS
ncbi:MAG: polyhydroxyalkanoate synthesis repressor PhaR, partial [Betaproteobacteria bacterium]|nr:polyhydroxyalkanoate synthesis repressor PhaR [Betaproteobacteria bacterium]